MLSTGYGLPNNNSNSNHNANKAVNCVFNTNAFDINTINNTLPTSSLNLLGPANNTVPSRSAFDLTNSIPTTTFDMFHPSQLNINNTCLALTTSPSKNEVQAEVTSGVGEFKKVIFEIPEDTIKNIFGPAGRSLLELQCRSGAIIQISKKGLCTSNNNGSNSSSSSSSINNGNSNNNIRILTISGSTAAVAAAQILLEHQMAEFDIKKLRNGVFSTD